MKSSGEYGDVAIGGYKVEMWDSAEAYTSVSLSLMTYEVVSVLPQN